MKKVRTQRRLRAKERAEMQFWTGKREEEDGTLGLPLDGQSLFCERFGLAPASYTGKRMLDVGCGPRGSLEWASMAAERVGLDPLADRYRELGTDRHAMTYVAGGAERMPFEDARFDVVSTFNSLDHVEDLDAALAETRRVTAPEGMWLLVVEAGAAATVTEPQRISWELLDDVHGWEVVSSRRIALDAGHDVHGSWGRGVDWTAGPGLLVARLIRL